METDRRGGVLSHHIIEILRVASDTFFQDSLFASSCGDIVVCAAVYAGQADGRPFTAGKLSDFIGMPRPTTIRKLKTLRKRGLVVNDGDGFWRIAVQDPGNSERINVAVDKLLGVIARTTAALSKMDGSAVASRGEDVSR